ncbi:MAG: Bug family tripartite tricarboxylate transporter substrate binding protein [bacterium]|jgi:tripartite-type tricarboxylate transporter receptor subunit TctC
MKKLVILALVLCLVAVMSVGCSSNGQQSASAPDYPTKEITVVVPWNAGGANDVAARQLQPIFKDMFGVNLVVKNVAGGSSAVGITEAINAKADGYTVGFATSTYIGLAAQGSVSSDLENDFENICLVMEDPIAIVCKAGAYENLEEFIEDARQRPGETVVATSNTFGTAPVYITLMAEQADIDTNMVCYDSGSRCVTEVLGGHVEVSCSNYGDFVSQVEAGEIEVLALMTPERSEVLPDVPTILECGYDVFGAGYIRQMSFMMAPKGLDPEVKETLSKMFQEACQSDSYQAFAKERSFTSPGIVGDDLDGIVKEVYDGLKLAYDKYFAD